MVGTLWELKEIASHLGVTIRVLEHALKRDGITPIAFASRLRLYLPVQVEEARAAVANTRHYSMVTSHSAATGIGHTSALGISIETGKDEASVKRALDEAGIKPAHVEPTSEQMYLDEEAAPIVEALKAK